MRKEFLVFGKPVIQKEEVNEVVDSLQSGWLSTGPKVMKFQEAFKEYIGSKYTVALNSCTAGLHLSMLVAGIGKGDEVITTPMTFAATANAIVHVGAKPVFVDIDRETMNIDPSLIERKINQRTRAIIPVHFAGRPCEMDTIMKLKTKYNLTVIDDAAHAIESEYKGRKIGVIADMTAFSFYVTKNLTTGEGGMVTTNNKKYARAMEALALHGMSRGAWRRYSDKGFKHYEIIKPGFKYNMMDIQAAIGIHQLKRVNEYLRRRRRVWEMYDDAFRNLPLIRPAPQEKGTTHARHLYTILVETEKLKVGRDRLQQALYEQNIGTGIHFISLHLHKYYRDRFGYKRGDFPNAEFVSDRTISLPLSAGLKDKDILDVIAAVKKMMNKYSK